MSRLQVKHVSSSVLEVEIAPDRHDKWLWLVWAVAAVLILAGAWHRSPPLTLRTLPSWLVVPTFAAVFLVKGWQGWAWGSRGSEKLRADPNELAYERAGSAFGRKSVRLPLGDISAVLVLVIGVDHSLAAYRLRLETKKRNLYLGRGLSLSQGRELRQLLESALSRHTRPPVH